MLRSGAEMAELENQVMDGGVIAHEQGLLADTQHEATDGGGQTNAPARLLVVLGEVQTVEQRDLAIDRLIAGLSSWDAEAGGCDVDAELNGFVKSQPKAIADPTGEVVLEHKSELLELQVLLNPRVQTLLKKLHLFLITDSRYRFLLHSGLTLQNSGCWFLQDGCFSFSSLVELFHRPDVQLETAKRTDAILDVSVVTETGDWTKTGIAKLGSQLNVRLNRPKVERGTDGAASLSSLISPYLKTPSLNDLLPSTKAVGNFGGQSAATMHIFPGGQGDSALFGVSGFNLLLDGGYARRSCFWEMVRHLPTLDATIVSHLGPDNIFGFASFLEKKVHAKESPELGVVYLNETKASPAASDSSPPSLVVSLVEKGQAMVDSLRQLGTPILPCLGSVQGQVLHPINLYHKVGHGSIDLYVLSPLSDLRETKMVGGQKTEHVSSSFLVTWKPTSPNERLTRILFPGNTPQAKIFEALDRLKTVALFQNASGVAEKIQAPGKGVEKAAGAKPTAAKAKPPIGSRPEGKGDGRKALPEQKTMTGGEQYKQIITQRGGPEGRKQSGDGGREMREGRKQSGDGGREMRKAMATAATDAKNGKTVGSIKKEKESPVKATPGPSRIAKKTEGEGGKGAKKAITKQPSAAGTTAAATTGGDVVKTKENNLPLDVDKTSAMPLPSEIDDPLNIVSPEEESAAAALAQEEVQALPDPTAPEEQLAEEIEMESANERMAPEQPLQPEEEEERLDKEDSLTGDEDAGEINARGDGQNVGVDESFDPSKEWGVPEGLPAPTNGKEPATAKKTSQSVSIAGSAAAANAKKPDTKGNAETKASMTKRPTTAPERLNNTTREEDDKTAANQSTAKGRLSVTSAHKDGATAAGRVEAKKQRPVIPFYVDVAYIPGHGNLHCFDVDFFRRVRARHYILSCVDPSAKALALLLEGKQTWEDSAAEVSIIPTYDSESMLTWIQENREHLQKQNIKIGPPAYKCRMQLQELDTSCASYRLEL